VRLTSEIKTDEPLKSYKAHLEAERSTEL